MAKLTKIEGEGKIMYLNKDKLYFIGRGHYDHARARILHHLRWNILPVIAMLMLFVWVSLHMGKIIDEKKPPVAESLVQVK
jgi:sorbitol-specific phosphotransferase system component IIC